MNYPDLDFHARARLRNNCSDSRFAFYDELTGQNQRATLIFGDPSDPPTQESYHCQARQNCYYEQTWPADTTFHDHTGGALQHRRVAIQDIERFWDHSTLSWTHDVCFDEVFDAPRVWKESKFTWTSSKEYNNTSLTTSFNLHEGRAEGGRSAEDPYAHIDTAADGTLYPHNPKAFLTRCWLGAGGHAKLDAIESYLAAFNEWIGATTSWESEYQTWLEHVPGDCDNPPEYPRLDDQFLKFRKFFPARGDAYVRPGIDEVLRRDALASMRHGVIPLYESTKSLPVCKVRFSDWISEEPFNCYKGRLQKDMVDSDVDSAYAEMEDEVYGCGEKEERAENTEEELESSECSDEMSEGTDVTSLGDSDAESIEDVKSKPGMTQSNVPSSTKTIALGEEGEAENTFVDAAQALMAMAIVSKQLEDMAICRKDQQYEDASTLM